MISLILILILCQLMKIIKDEEILENGSCV